MSAEDDIAGMLSQATLRAETFSARAASFIGQAAVALEDSAVQVRSRYAVQPQGEALNGTAFALTEPTEPPLGFPAWPVVELPMFPDLQELDALQDGNEPTIPTVDTRVADYGELSQAPRFEVVPPEVEGSPTLPPVPRIEVAFTPTFQDIKTMEAPAFNTPDVAFNPVAVTLDFDPQTFQNAFTAFKRRIFGDVDPLLDDMEAWSRQTLDELIPALLDAVSTRMADRYAPALAYNRQLRERLEQRLAEQAQRLRNSAADTSGWGRPAAAQRALETTAARAAEALMAQSRSQAETDTAEVSAALFETCSEVFAQLSKAVQMFRLRQLEQVLETHSAAVSYAKKVTTALLTAFEAETITQQVAELKRTTARVQVFELQLTLATTRYTVAKAMIEAESAKQEVDGALVQRLSADAEQARADAALYASLVAAARSELEAVKQPFEMFQAQVQAFDAQMDAHATFLQTITAEESTYEARIRSLTTKVKVFESQVSGFEERVRTRGAVVQSQQERNEAVLEEFTARAHFLLQQAEQELLENRYDLTQYQVIADKLISEIESKLAEANLALDYRRQDQSGALEAYKLQKDILSDVAADELERMKALAQVHAEGARVMSAMAEGAMSAANGVAGVVLTES